MCTQQDNRLAPELCGLQDLFTPRNLSPSLPGDYVPERRDTQLVRANTCVHRRYKGR